MKKYSTAQRKLLLSFLKEHRDQQYTVEELAEQLCHIKSISISSIYRNINQMLADGMVQRFTVDHSRQSLYQYLGDNDCSNHMHLKCEGCGQIFHMDDQSLKEIMGAAIRNSDFNIDIRKTILYGSCKNCN